MPKLAQTRAKIAAALQTPVDTQAAKANGGNLAVRVSVRDVHWLVAADVVQIRANYVAKAYLDERLQVSALPAPQISGRSLFLLAFPGKSPMI